MAKIAILGDYNHQSETHIATDLSLELATNRLGVNLSSEWIPTQQISGTSLNSFDALIVNTGLYSNRDAVLHALKIARESKIPTLATCGGFQHMIIEYARNVLMLEGVGHAEFDPQADSHIIVPLQCSLRGLEGNISISRDTLVRQLYQVDEATEKFYCSFGVSASHVNAISQTGLRVVGTDEQGLVRVTELSDHPFFIGTLFVPQARALKGESHPLMEGLIKCASIG